MEDNKNNRPTFELLFNDEMSESGVQLISFVEEPAIEVDWMVFSKGIEKYKFQEDGDKYLVTGPAMIPNQKIVRMTDDGELFDVFFSEDTIRKCSELFFMNNNHQSTNINHTSTSVEGVSVVESWIIEDSKNDKSNSLGYDLPKGTWMATYKVNDIELWNKIKSGDVKGFSIEGYFIDRAVSLQKEEVSDSLYDYINIILSTSITDEHKYDLISKFLRKN